jgi:hypothetical protein
MSMDRECNNAAFDKKSSPLSKNFLLGIILHPGNSFSLFEPVCLMDAVRNNS